MTEDSSERAATRRAAAERRFDELEALRLKLAAGQRLDADDLALAGLRARESQWRAAQARDSAIAAHRDAAVAHRAAAVANEAVGRWPEAMEHRRAAESDLLAAGEHGQA